MISFQVKRGKEDMVREYIGKALRTNSWGETRIQEHLDGNGIVRRRRFTVQ